MSVSWTSEQKQVIEARSQNILVSAAAGSGKTAVLVERILSMVKDRENPADIDELLVVTFTRAAAGEMRERIGRALLDALESDPGNEHLQRQQTLLHHAQINTIHGFCSYVIQNYFQLIDLDPGYRLADEGETKLLKADVAGAVVEEAYEAGTPEFLHFVECYAAGRTDEKIDELILTLYDFSASYPWPDEWLVKCGNLYACTSDEELGESGFVQYLMEETKRSLADIRDTIAEQLRISVGEEGPYLYEPMLKEDLLAVEQLLHAGTFDELVQGFSRLSFAALSRKKDAAVSDVLREQVKGARDGYKKSLKELQERYFTKSLHEAGKEMADGSAAVKVLIELTRRFGEEYAARKRKKNILDFSDLEHFALEILVQRDGEAIVPTEAAREIAGQFREIMIDEYQDSNYIQEALLSAVSGETDGNWNRFMVGDIKQSIYGFRLARPELFLEKYHSYEKDTASCRRIDLHKNFRSRDTVLTTANFLFRQLMCEPLGGIRYDDAASLYPGAVFPEWEDGTDQALYDYRTEVILLNRDAPEMEDDTSKESLMEAEAAVVAERIRSMVGREWIADKESGGYRPAAYRDIVILLRTMSGWSEAFLRVLQANGIPAYAASRTGYFSAREVVLVLDYLHICDNPMQEIPFAAVLRSPIVGCTDPELAAIRCMEKEVPIYEACERYAKEGESGRLREKLKKFLSVLAKMREKVPYTPIHELITEILHVTGYGNYAAAMPGGAQRKANLDMLVEKAVEFEGTSYRGLFNFIRYIEQLQKYEVDFGEVGIFGEGADTVRIMSIHKSKGLEFPVVFLSGTGKSFNQSDSRAALVLHSRLGIGADVIDPVLRTKGSTLPKQVIRRALSLENLAEELRVLYVAVTRAKEKLIITGAAGKLEKKASALLSLAGRKEEVLSYRTLTLAKSYLDWILSALARNACMDSVYDACGLEPEKGNPLYGEKLPVVVKIAEPGGLAQEELLRQMDLEVQKKRIWEIRDGESSDEQLKNLIEERFGYEYPYEKRRSIPVKLTVSELKKAGAEESEEGEALYPVETVVPYVPAFIRKETPDALRGADRGTAYHRLLQCLDYGHADHVSEVDRQIASLVEEGKMEQEQADCIYRKAIVEFVHSGIGRRMQKAAARGQLVLEQPFVMAIPASRADSSYPEDEQILVQGMIDAWFPEGDGIVLVDYKTDRVTDDTGRMLAERYEKQLVYYREALERLTGKRVKEMNLYSFSIGKNITVPVNGR